MQLVTVQAMEPPLKMLDIQTQCNTILEQPNYQEQHMGLGYSIETLRGFGTMFLIGAMGVICKVTDFIYYLLQMITLSIFLVKK